MWREKASFIAMISLTGLERPGASAGPFGRSVTLSVGEEDRTRTRQAETPRRSVWLPGGILPRE